MKKLLVLIGILALVAALVVPLAASAAPLVGGDVEATGVMVAPTVSITVPSGGISLGNFADGRNPSTGYDWSTVTFGTITLTLGSDAAATFTATANSVDDGYGNFSAGKMFCAGIGYLANPMYVSFGDTSNAAIGTPGYLPTGAILTGNASTNFSLGAAQEITSADAKKGAGTYYIYVQVSAQANY